MEPGGYSLEIDSPGFRQKKVGGIRIVTASEVTVNQSLEVSGVDTVVEVQEAPPGVELATTASISRTLPQRVIENMPLTAGMRDINTLAMLAPTAIRTTQLASGFAVNGQWPRNNNFMIDEVDNNDLSIAQQNSRVLPEAIQEYQVHTSPYSAEYGRSSQFPDSVDEYEFSGIRHLRFSIPAIARCCYRRRLPSNRSLFYRSPLHRPSAKESGGL